jgi:hypothetical protein
MSPVSANQKSLILLDRMAGDVVFTWGTVKFWGYMNFKTKQRWKNGLAALGLIGLGYFIGRPDQLERIARNLSNWAESQPRYIIPATVTTIHQPVLIHRQPVIVRPAIVVPQTQSQVQIQGWSQLSDPQARFSVLVPVSLRSEEIPKSRLSP